MLNWRKSSHSDLNGGGNCVEIATDKTITYIRDSKNKERLSLKFKRQTLKAVIKGIRQ